MPYINPRVKGDDQLIVRLTYLKQRLSEEGVIR
jgi:hypothetical protein